LDETFKVELRSWRGERLQKQAADVLKVSLRTYENWERGANIPDGIKIEELRRRMKMDTDYRQVIEAVAQDIHSRRER